MNKQAPARSFKILGLLLSYPDETWMPYAATMADVLQQEKLLSATHLKKLQPLLRRLQDTDLLESQEHYVSLFDRSRALSLHLFEHVHGESRDRGQAMVDLAEVYKQHGLEVATHELPDYLPLFLEYLSHLPVAEALDFLAEPKAILAVMAQRLAERGSDYAAVLECLCTLTGATVKPATFVPPPEEAVDADWEEPPIAFLGADAPKSCGTACTGACGGNGHATAERQQP